MKNDNISSLRKIMGTVPKINVKLETPFFEGVRDIKVELFDYPVNPYLAIFNMATSTWGNRINKWDDTSTEGRLWVIKSVLEFKSLPNAMESISFTFGVENCSRSAFDQIARSRIGAVYSSMGWRDNDHSDIGFRVPQSIWNNLEERERFISLCLLAKEYYHGLVKSGKSNWQDARAYLPISACHNFSMAMNYMALRNFMGKRLKFCEMADTVAVAWLMRERVMEKYPLLGSYLRPSCDWKGKCEYHQNNMMSEAFGCLLKECGRNVCLASDNYAIFNYACSDRDVIQEQLGMKIPLADEDMPVDGYDDLLPSDKLLFEVESQFHSKLLGNNR